MRISSDPTDPAYTQHFHLCRIWLAGAERSNCVLADEEKRYAVTLARDEFGRPVLDKDGNQVRQEFWGDVRIESPDWLRLQTSGDEDSGALGAAVWAMCQTP
jgi:hypothetical protein